MKVTYYYILMTQKSLFSNQVLEEILREKANYHIVNKKKKDFWILTSPKFVIQNNMLDKLKNTLFYKNNEKNINYLSSIVSTDKNWIRWLELRIGYFENNKTDYNTNSEFSSDGITGFFESENNLMLLENVYNIDPTIISKEYEYIGSILDPI